MSKSCRGRAPAASGVGSERWAAGGGRRAMGRLATNSLAGHGVAPRRKRRVWGRRLSRHERQVRTPRSAQGGGPGGRREWQSGGARPAAPAALAAQPAGMRPQDGLPRCPVPAPPSTGTAGRPRPAGAVSATCSARGRAGPRAALHWLSVSLHYRLAALRTVSGAGENGSRPAEQLHGTLQQRCVCVCRCVC